MKRTAWGQGDYDATENSTASIAQETTSRRSLSGIHRCISDSVFLRSCRFRVRHGHDCGRYGNHSSGSGAREGAFGFPSTLNFDDNGAGNTDPIANDDIADAIALVMDEYLAVHNIEIRQDGVNDDLTKPNAYVRIARATVVAERGDQDLAAACTQAGAAPAAGEIVVTLCFPLVDAANPTGVGNPVPDWLSSVGFSLATYRFEATSRALLE